MERCTNVKCKIMLGHKKLQLRLLSYVSKLIEFLYIINSSRVYFSRLHVCDLYAGSIEYQIIVITLFQSPYLRLC